MLGKKILAKLVGVAGAAVKYAKIEEDGSLVVGCGPRRGQACRCAKCGRKAPVRDRSPKPRRWRSLDLGTTPTYVECATVRVACPECGVHVAAVPWAAHASRFTHAFEEQLAWLCVHCNRSTVAELMRVDWKTVGPVCGRVRARAEAALGRGRFDGLVRIGVDETSYKKGHKYMTVVLDHDTGRVVWCAKGHGKEVLEGFFDLLTEGQRASIRVVTADGARWVADVVAERCAGAERVMDPFHVVSWMQGVLDEVRRQAWRDARKGPDPEAAKSVKGSKYALLKNPEDLTESQSLALERLAREDGRLYRAYLLKERLRDVFKAPGGPSAAALLDSWLRSACHSWVPEIKELSKKVRRHRDAIVRAVELGISNARVEAINNKIKVTVRMAYGFRNFDNLMDLVMLRCSNLPIALPGRP